MGHAVPTATTNRARILGIVALVVGVVGAIVLWMLASKRYDDAVADLAPAPVGCDTTLVFDRTGTYTFFVETMGEVGEIDGDCDGDDREYDFDGDETPRVDLTLVDGDGDEVDLDRASGPSLRSGWCQRLRRAHRRHRGHRRLRAAGGFRGRRVHGPRRSRPDERSGADARGRSGVAGGGARPGPDRPDPRAPPGRWSGAGRCRGGSLDAAHRPALAADGAAVRQPADSTAVRHAAGMGAAGGAGAASRWPAPAADATGLNDGALTAGA